jgi:hypothetical protein
MAMKKLFLTPRLNRSARWLRGLWPDRNPLRRATDRAEAAITALTLITFLAVAPLSAVIAARWAGTVASNTGPGYPRQVSAVLVTKASPAFGSIIGGLVQPYARARWAGPGRVMRTGEVPVPPDAAAGRTVTIWTDGSGRLTNPPASPGQQEASAGVSAMLAILGSGLVLLCAYRLGRSVLDKRRMAGWDRDWRGIGPTWSGRR